MSSRKRSRGSGNGPGGPGGRGRAGQSSDLEAWGGRSRAATLGCAELDAARQPAPSSARGETYMFYHGTAWETAERILREGFKASTEGCLGPGIYVARREKAERFAKDHSRHSQAVGGLVEVLVTVKNPKFVEVNADWNDASWRAAGHDACRAEFTTASTNMEWCIRDSSQIQVLRTMPIRCDKVDAEVEERALEKHAVALEAEIREREQKTATLREWVGSIKRKRAEEQAEKERVEQERLAAEARERERQRLAQERQKLQAKRDARGTSKRYFLCPDAKEVADDIGIDGEIRFVAMGSCGDEYSS
eukprot:SAG31_NODE_1775_length_7303_cov_2.409356_8_plen_306_part_00